MAKLLDLGFFAILESAITRLALSFELERRWRVQEDEKSPVSFQKPGSCAASRLLLN